MKGAINPSELVWGQQSLQGRGRKTCGNQFKGEEPINALHYGNILEYLRLWSEVQFLNVQNSKNIQEIQKPNQFGLHSRDLPENWKNVDFKL